MNKYGAERTQVGGLMFDSKAEAHRYTDLLLMEKCGAITGLKRQVKFELAPSVKLVGDKKARPPIRIVVDFSYVDSKSGEVLLEDTKGFDTAMGRTKRHFLKSIHGLDVRLTS